MEAAGAGLNRDKHLLPPPPCPCLLPLPAAAAHHDHDARLPRGNGCCTQGGGSQRVPTATSPPSLSPGRTASSASPPGSCRLPVSLPPKPALLQVFHQCYGKTPLVWCNLMSLQPRALNSKQDIDSPLLSSSPFCGSCTAADDGMETVFGAEYVSLHVRVTNKGAYHLYTNTLGYE